MSVKSVTPNNNGITLFQFLHTKTDQAALIFKRLVLGCFDSIQDFNKQSFNLAKTHPILFTASVVAIGYVAHRIIEWNLKRTQAVPDAPPPRLAPKRKEVTPSPAPSLTPSSGTTADASGTSGAGASSLPFSPPLPPPPPIVSENSEGPTRSEERRSASSALLDQIRSGKPLKKVSEGEKKHSSTLSAEEPSSEASKKAPQQHQTVSPSTAPQIAAPPANLAQAAAGAKGNLKKTDRPAAKTPNPSEEPTEAERLAQKMDEARKKRESEKSKSSGSTNPSATPASDSAHGTPILASERRQSAPPAFTLSEVTESHPSSSSDGRGAIATRGRGRGVPSTRGRGGHVTAPSAAPVSAALDVESTPASSAESETSSMSTASSAETSALTSASEENNKTT